MSLEITIDDIDALALGAAFLGTGGGGDPYIGALLCKAVIAKHGPVKVVTLDELGDDINVFSVAGLGAPTVMIEKLISVEDAHRAVETLEQHLGRRAGAIIAAEIGGINSTLPIAYAAMRGLPIIDADGMGRAFPSIDMVSFNIYGTPCTPMCVADEHGNTVIFNAKTAKLAEDLARSIVVVMGGSVSLSCYPMSGAQAKRSAVPATLSAALKIGRALLEKPADGSPLDALLSTLRQLPYYGSAHRLFEGKIVDIARDTRDGWVFGRCEIAQIESGHRASVIFQNENIAVEVNGEPKAVVPDLVCIVDTETARPITTENLRYGQRVSVVACSAAPQMLTPEALAVVGPKAFGLSYAYQSIEQLIAGSAVEAVGG